MAFQRHRSKFPNDVLFEERESDLAKRLARIVDEELDQLEERIKKGAKSSAPTRKLTLDA